METRPFEALFFRGKLLVSGKFDSVSKASNVFKCYKQFPAGAVLRKSYAAAGGTKVQLYVLEARNRLNIYMEASSLEQS